jgi:single-strand DNA-binding protein
MNDSHVTLQGYLGGEVRLHETGETPVANFRVGSTPSWVDRRTGQWVDGTTVWYSVSAWRGLARNCADSLRRGDPVVVHGRLTTRTYVNNNGVEVSDLEVTATFVGHDLNRGRSTFTKVQRQQSTTQPGAAEEAATETAA